MSACREVQPLAAEQAWEPRCGVCWREMDFSQPRKVRMVTTDGWCIPVHQDCYDALVDERGGRVWAEAEIRCRCGAVPVGG